MGARRAIALAAGVVVLVALALAVAGRGGDASSPTGPPPDASQCGWDLTTEAGVKANQDYLSATAQWLASRPDDSTASPPPPEGPYWRGECPAPEGDVPAPPVDEAGP